jgi:hypothetical protein
MIKRPLDPRFSEAVKAGRKFTTIRDKPWPTGKPIMLYNWSGKPYRSPQVDVAPIVVLGFWTIYITHHLDGTMHYEYGMENDKPLWETEGFESQKELDDWFRPLIMRGFKTPKCLMRFQLAARLPEGKFRQTYGAPFRFTLGESYELQNGQFVKIVARHLQTAGYETIEDEAGVHRYDRSTHDSDAGRVTGTAHDYSCPENIKRYSQPVQPA